MPPARSTVLTLALALVLAPLPRAGGSQQDVGARLSAQSAQGGGLSPPTPLLLTGANFYDPATFGADARGFPLAVSTSAWHPSGTSDLTTGGGGRLPGPYCRVGPADTTDPLFAPPQPASFINRTLVRCDTIPAVASPRTVPVALSLSGPDGPFVSGGGRFTYVDSAQAPTISVIRPASAPRAGGTVIRVHGANFHHENSSHRCVFSFAHRPAAAVSPPPPPAPGSACDHVACGPGAVCRDVSALRWTAAAGLQWMNYSCSCGVGFSGASVVDGPASCVDTAGCDGHHCGAGASCVDVPAPGVGYVCELAEPVHFVSSSEALCVAPAVPAGFVARDVRQARLSYRSRAGGLPSRSSNQIDLAYTATSPAHVTLGRKASAPGAGPGQGGAGPVQALTSVPIFAGQAATFTISANDGMSRRLDPSGDVFYISAAQMLPNLAAADAQLVQGSYVYRAYNASTVTQAACLARGDSWAPPVCLAAGGSGNLMVSADNLTSCERTGLTWLNASTSSCVASDSQPGSPIVAAMHSDEGLCTGGKRWVSRAGGPHAQCITAAGRIVASVLNRTACITMSANSWTNGTCIDASGQSTDGASFGGTPVVSGDVSRSEAQRRSACLTSENNIWVDDAAHLCVDIASGVSTVTNNESSCTNSRRFVRPQVAGCRDAGGNVVLSKRDELQCEYTGATWQLGYCHGLEGSITLPRRGSYQLRVSTGNVAVPMVNLTVRGVSSSDRCRVTQPSACTYNGSAILSPFHFDVVSGIQRTTDGFVAQTATISFAQTVSAATPGITTLMDWPAVTGFPFTAAEPSATVTFFNFAGMITGDSTQPLSGSLSISTTALQGTASTIECQATVIVCEPKPCIIQHSRIPSAGLGLLLAPHVVPSAKCAAGASLPHLARCNMSCAPGYSVSGRQPLCFAGSLVHAAENIHCEPNPCVIQNISAPAKGTLSPACVNGSTLPHGSGYCFVSCDAGWYVSNHNDQPSCYAGTFTPGSVRCLPIPCKIQEVYAPPHGYKTNQVIGAAAAAPCMSNVGPSVAEQSQGIASYRPLCNCNQDFTLWPGQSCHLRCATGYTLAGVQPHCDAGNTAHLASQSPGHTSAVPGSTVHTGNINCIPNNCSVPALTPPPNGILNTGCTNGSILQHGSSCAITCDPGYVAVGMQPSCLTGTFNPGTLVCLPNFCVVRQPLPQAPPHGKLGPACLAGNVLPHGGDCGIVCDAGYVLAGRQPTCHAGSMQAGNVSCMPDERRLVVLDHADGGIYRMSLDGSSSSLMLNTSMYTSASPVDTDSNRSAGQTPSSNDTARCVPPTGRPELAVDSARGHVYWTQPAAKIVLWASLAQGRSATSSSLMSPIEDGSIRIGSGGVGDVAVIDGTIFWTCSNLHACGAAASSSNATMVQTLGPAGIVMASGMGHASVDVDYGDAAYALAVGNGDVFWTGLPLNHSCADHSGDCGVGDQNFRSILRTNVSAPPLAGGAVGLAVPCSLNQTVRSQVGILGGNQTMGNQTRTQAGNQSPPHQSCIPAVPRGMLHISAVRASVLAYGAGFKVFSLVGAGRCRDVLGHPYDRVCFGGAGMSQTACEDAAHSTTGALGFDGSFSALVNRSCCILFDDGAAQPAPAGWSLSQISSNGTGAVGSADGVANFSCYRLAGTTPPTLYWAEWNTSSILSRAVGASSDTTLAANASCGKGATDLVVDGPSGWLYWTAGSKLRRLCVRPSGCLGAADSHVSAGFPIGGELLRTSVGGSFSIAIYRPVAPCPFTDAGRLSAVCTAAARHGYSVSACAADTPGCAAAVCAYCNTTAVPPPRHK